MGFLFLLLGALLLLVGTFVALRGFRGEAMLTDPCCGKCGYDLRGHLMQNAAGEGQSKTCPECGADLMARGGVKFGERQRRPVAIWVGVALGILPLLLLAGLMTRVGARVAMAPVGSVASKQAMSNAELIADLSKGTNVDAPWDWQILEARVRSGQLINDEAAQAVDVLIKALDAKRKRTGRTEPLHWVDGFLKQVDAAGAMAPEQRDRLYRSFYGPAPKINMNPRVREGNVWPLRVDWGGPWNLEGVKFVYALREVRLGDGTKLKLRENKWEKREPDPDLFSREGTWSIDGEVMIDQLKPGDYEVEFVFDAGVVPKDSPMGGMQRRPGQKGRWMNPLMTWPATQPMRLTIAPKESQIVTLVTGAADDPVKAGVLKAPRVIVRREQSGKSVEVEWTVSGNMPVPVVADVFVRFNGVEKKWSEVIISGSGTNSRAQTVADKNLPAVNSPVDVILRPNARAAERSPETARIWGTEIVFKGVVPQRFDLPVPATAP